MRLAELIGVSCMKISRAINRPHRVKQETRRLIEEGMRKHHILPNASARNLRRSRKKTIGFVVPDSPNFYYLEACDLPPISRTSDLGNRLL